MIKRHWVEAAPAPPRGVHYHHACEAAGWLYVTGQLPSDPRDPGGSFGLDIVTQAERVFANLIVIVESAGYRLGDAVFVRIYLAEFDRDYDAFNEVYGRFFPTDPLSPSRTTVGVARLGRGALVEIDLTLYKGTGGRSAGV